MESPAESLVFGTARSVKQVGSQVPKVTLAIRDVSLQPMTPLASMLAMERCRGRPLTVSDFRYALVESGVEFTSTEVRIPRHTTVPCAPMRHRDRCASYNRRITSRST